MMQQITQFLYRTGIVFIGAGLVVSGIAFFYFKQYKQSSFITRYNGRPIQQTNRIAIYAHRGGRGLAPENTLLAYKNALKNGVDYVDMDINMTKDGILVVYHNTTLDPNITRDESGKFITKPVPIRHLTYKELQRYNVGQINPKTKYASFFKAQRVANLAKIPTLRAVIALVKKNTNKSVGFQMEIKAHTDDLKKDAAFYTKLISTLYQLLKDENIIDQTEVQSFEWPLLIQLQSYDTRIKTTYLTGLNKKELIEAYQKKIPDPSIPKIIRFHHGCCWSPFELVVTQKDVQEAHQNGIKIIPWGKPAIEKTDFNTSVIMNLIHWHVDGIITDRPDILRNTLAAHGYGLPQIYH
jgi:glycerophosphoryl diester phosphodiesterase